MADKIRWGIIGTGAISHHFARGLGVLADAQLVAVASRTKGSADKFGEEFNVPHRHIGAEAIAADEDVDVIYIGTPHPMHVSDTLASLAGGKAVLCEKPFAMNSSEVMQMVACAKKNKLFLMEAMWTYFLPAITEVRRLITSGAIGEIRLVQSTFGFRCQWDPQSRLLNPVLGGGALLDVGVYDIAIAQMAYGREPVRINSMAHIGQTGVDEQGAMIFGYDNGAMAVLTYAVRTQAVNEAAIYGTDGYIRILPNFWHAERIIVKAGQADEKEIKFEMVGNGYNYQAVEVMQHLRSGKTESSIMPLSTSIAMMKTMDRVRAQWGLTYPMEK
ncbi:MAG: Gfo/Idh/MocA family oxidoreductase [Phycisphaerae bacterium]|nr:Gfo/Idh/MocA family oxidoreductase [Phycisphaerae bacterium]